MTDENEFIYDDFKVAQTFNNYFVNITESLPIFKWNSHLPTSSIYDIVQKFENHDSIINIRGLGFSDTFEFSHIFSLGNPGGYRETGFK